MEYDDGVLFFFWGIEIEYFVFWGYDIWLGWFEDSVLLGF